MTTLKRWAIGDRLFIGVLIIMAIIAFVDVLQIEAFFALNTQTAWDLYNQHTLPSLIKLWVLTFFVLAAVYWMFTKDWSETVGLFFAAMIMLFGGVEDVFYFMFSSQSMTECMQWFNDLGAPVATWAKVVFNQNCVSPEALITCAIASVLIAYFGYKYLQKRKW